jgi:hypothetical protein
MASKVGGARQILLGHDGVEYAQQVQVRVRKLIGRAFAAVRRGSMDAGDRRQKDYSQII